MSASTLSVTVDRSSLSLADYVIGDDATTGLWLDSDGQSRPAMTWQRTYAGSQWVHGQLLTQATLTQSSLPLAVYLSNSTTAGLYTAMDELAAAFGQFYYPLTVDENGSSKTWGCDPADIAWGDFVSGWSDIITVRAALTVPVYPVAS